MISFEIQASVFHQKRFLIKLMIHRERFSFGDFFYIQTFYFLNRKIFEIKSNRRGEFQPCLKLPLFSRVSRDNGKCHTVLNVHFTCPTGTGHLFLHLGLILFFIKNQIAKIQLWKFLYNLFIFFLGDLLIRSKHIYVIIAWEE